MSSILKASLRIIPALILFIICGCSSSRKKAEERAWQMLEKEVLLQAGNFKGEAGIVVQDLKRGREVTLNPDKAVPSASMVKVPIMAACFYAYQEGKLDFKGCLVIKNRYKALGSGRLKCLPDGTVINIRELIEIMVAESDNTATNMLIESLGRDYLNGIFQKLGLKDTNLSREMMDFKSRRKGVENFTTARDIALVLNRIYQGKLLNREVSRECLEILKKQKMKDRIPKRLPRDIIVAHKTGLERGVCHDAGIVFAPGGDMLVCVLTKHKQKTSRDAKEFISEVALSVYNYTQQLIASGGSRR